MLFGYTDSENGTTFLTELTLLTRLIASRCVLQETISTGPFVMRSTCRYCYGTRLLVKTPCIECEGKGNTIQRRRITVPVPAGM